MATKPLAIISATSVILKSLILLPLETLCCLVSPPSLAADEHNLASIRDQSGAQMWQLKEGLTRLRLPPGNWCDPTIGQKRYKGL